MVSRLRSIFFMAHAFTVSSVQSGKLAGVSDKGVPLKVSAVSMIEYDHFSSDAGINGLVNSFDFSLTFLQN